MRRIISCIIIISLLIGVLTGCYDRREVDELAYVMAIGLDKGKINKLKVTFQIAIPKGIGGGGSGGSSDGGGGGDKGFFYTSVEAPSIYSAINMMNTYVDRELNLSHAKALVVSKEVAEAGIGEILHSFTRVREIRPNIGFYISRGIAEKFIKAVKPSLEASVSKYYELSADNYTYNSFTGNTEFFNFYNQALSYYNQPVATLVGLNRFKSSEDIDQSGSTALIKGENEYLEGDYKAGDVPRYGDAKAEFMGLAVFDGAKMVGELDGEEAGYYLMATGDYNRANWSVSDPLSKGQYVVLNIKQSRNPVQKVDISGGNPACRLEVRLEADILNIQSGTNYEDLKKLPILEQWLNDYFKENIEKFLNRTSKDLHSDICGFGKKVKSKFLTWKEWENYNWLSKYKDSKFDVMVDIKIRRPGLIIRTIPIKSSEDMGGVTQ